MSSFTKFRINNNMNRNTNMNNFFLFSLINPLSSIIFIILYDTLSYAKLVNLQYLAYFNFFIKVKLLHRQRIMRISNRCQASLETIKITVTNIVLDQLPMSQQSYQYSIQNINVSQLQSSSTGLILLNLCLVEAILSPDEIGARNVVIQILHRLMKKIPIFCEFLRCCYDFVEKYHKITTILAMKFVQTDFGIDAALIQIIYANIQKMEPSSKIIQNGENHSEAVVNQEQYFMDLMSNPESSQRNPVQEISEGSQQEGAEEYNEEESGQDWGEDDEETSCGD